MTGAEQRSDGSDAVRLAGYSARRDLMRTAVGRVHLRQALAVGGLGVQLELDTVPGVVWADVWDAEAGSALMPPAHVHVEVWGGELAELAVVVDRVKPPGVLVTLRRHRPSRYRRALRWARFTLWRVVSWFEGGRR